MRVFFASDKPYDDFSFITLTEKDHNCSLHLSRKLVHDIVVDEDSFDEDGDNHYGVNVKDFWIIEVEIEDGDLLYGFEAAQSGNSFTECKVEVISSTHVIE